jgi:hypothetical protein
MYLRWGVVTDNIDDEINVDSIFVKEGLYFTHLSRYIRKFDQEQILVMFYDDLKADPKNYWQNVLNFLEVDHSFEPSLMNKKYQARKPRPRFLPLYKFFVNIGKSIKERSDAGRKIFEYAHKSGMINYFYKFVKGPNFPVMSQKKKQELTMYYKSEIKSLSRLLNRDLTEWFTRES